jgi:hypothetical protein
VIAFERPKSLEAVLGGDVLVLVYGAPPQRGPADVIDSAV